MADENDWKTWTAIGGTFAAAGYAVARLMWWLSEQFRKTRHAQDSTVTALGLEIDALDMRIGKLETRVDSLERQK